MAALVDSNAAFRTSFKYSSLPPASKICLTDYKKWDRSMRDQKNLSLLIAERLAKEEEEALVWQISFM